MNNQNEQQRPEREISYTPIGERETLKLTLAIVKSQLVTPTKSGKYPEDRDIITYMMLCRARGLNPFLGDVVITGYDTQAGPKFEIITAKSAVDKRADANPEFNGLESGVIVTANGKIEKREGVIVLDDETLIGAWSRVFRRDREHPYYHEVTRKAYDKKQARWNIDPEGMLVKCAEAGALRKAFPNSFGGLFLAEEISVVSENSSTTIEQPASDRPAGLPAPRRQREALPQESVTATPAAQGPVESSEPAGAPAEKRAPSQRKQTTPPPAERAEAAQAPAAAKPQEPAQSELLKDGTNPPNPPVSQPLKRQPAPAKSAPAQNPQRPCDAYLRQLMSESEIKETECLEALAIFGLGTFAKLEDVPETEVRKCAQDFETLADIVRNQVRA
jgi:phage recombination protein Bet